MLVRGRREGARKRERSINNRQTKGEEWREGWRDKEETACVIILISTKGK